MSVSEPGPQTKQNPRSILIFSNRGPGEYRDERGPLTWLPGGLSMVLIPPVLAMAQRGVNVLWGAMPNTRWDRVRADSGELRAAGPAEPESAAAVLVRFLKYTKEQMLHYYGNVANTRDWQGHHGGKHSLTKQQLMKSEAVSRHTWSQQARYIVQNAQDDSVVQIHDFQLSGVGRRVRQELDKYNRRRLAEGKTPKRLHLVGFWHIPFGTLEELLDSFRETREDCPRFKEFLRDMEAISWGFHSEQWQSNYEDAFTEVFGRLPESDSFIQPALIDPHELQDEAQSPVVQEAMNWINEQLDKDLGGRSFNGEVITVVSRCDPKNGQPQSVRAMAKSIRQIIDNLPEGVDPPALLISAPRARKGTAVFDEEWEMVDDEITALEAEFGHRGVKIIRLYDEKRGFESASRAKSVAAFRRATITLTPAERGGRDIVAQEAIGLKLPEDPPVVLIASAMAATSETLEGFIAEESMVVGHHPETNMPIRRVSGKGVVKGAIILGGIGPEVDMETQSIRIAAGIRQAMTMPRSARLQRMEAMLESVRMEDPYRWFSRLEAAAIDSSIKRGIIPLKVTPRGTHRFRRFLFGGPSEQTAKHLALPEHREIHGAHGSRVRFEGIGYDDHRRNDQRKPREEAFVSSDVTDEWTRHDLEAFASISIKDRNAPLGLNFLKGLGGLEAAYKEAGLPMPMLDEFGDGGRPVATTGHAIQNSEPMLS